MLSWFSRSSSWSRRQLLLDPDDAGLLPSSSPAPASQAASQSMLQPAIIWGRPRTMLTATAPLSGVEEITDTEEVTGSNPASPTSITPGQSQVPGSQTVPGRGSRDGCLPNCLPKPPASQEGVHRARAALSTGRTSFSVRRLLAWPTRWEMSSIPIPVVDGNDTKLCRSSCGVVPLQLGPRVACRDRPNRDAVARRRRPAHCRAEAGCRRASP